MLQRISRSLVKLALHFPYSTRSSVWRLCQAPLGEREPVIPLWRMRVYPISSHFKQDFKVLSLIFRVFLFVFLSPRFQRRVFDCTACSAYQVDSIGTREVALSFLLVPLLV
jgi:hypothetical protein